MDDEKKLQVKPESNEPLKEDSKKCPKCGKELSNEYNVCPYCGKSFKQNEILNKIQDKKLPLIVLACVLLVIILIVVSVNIKADKDYKEQVEQQQKQEQVEQQKYESEQKTNINKLTGNIKISGNHAKSLINGFVTKLNTYNDINKAFQYYYGSNSVVKQVSALKTEQSDINKLYKDIDDPSSDLTKAVTAYNNLANLAMEPKGSKVSYTQEVNRLINEFDSALNMVY